MEKETALGSVGKLDLSFSGGKAMATGEMALPGGFSMTLSMAEDAMVFMDLVFAAIEKSSPAGAVMIEESVKSIMKAAVKAIG